jgi:hypothetical protein
VTVNPERLGVEENFAKAMTYATGDVIFFADCDDVWVSDKVAKMVAPFEAEPQVMLVYSDGYITGPNLEKSPYTLFSWKAEKKRLADGDARPIVPFTRKGQAPGIKASSMAFAAKVRDLAGPLPYGVAHGNWMAFFGYALGKVVAINEPLHYYRRHDQAWGSSSTNTLFNGLQAPRDQSMQLRRNKAHLSQCYYARMVALEREMAGKMTFPPRFQELKVAARAAARTLRARAEIKKTRGRLRRVIKGSLALFSGAYQAVHGFKPKIKQFYKDIR